MGKHTPGPWKVSADLSDGCSLGDGLYVQHVDGRAIAFASSGNKADAVLIAAAPDLLEVARGVLAVFDDPDLHAQAVLVGQARAAIAKATGPADGKERRDG